MAAESPALSYQQVREKIMQGEMEVNAKYPEALTDPSVLQLAVQEQDSEFIDYNGMVCYRLEYEQGKTLGVIADDQ